MRIVPRLVVGWLGFALVFQAFACAVTKFYPLDWNAAAVAGALEALFPEILFEFDSGARILKATGCDKQQVLLKPLLDAAKKGDAAQWQLAVEKRLWNSAGQVGLFHHSVYEFDLKMPTGNWKTVAVTPDSVWAARLGGKALKRGQATFCDINNFHFLFKDESSATLLPTHVMPWLIPPRVRTPNFPASHGTRTRVCFLTHRPNK